MKLSKKELVILNRVKKKQALYVEGLTKQQASDKVIGLKYNGYDAYYRKAAKGYNVYLRRKNKKKRLDVI